jgi:hypothetical protein
VRPGRHPSLTKYPQVDGKICMEGETIGGAVAGPRQVKGRHAGHALSMHFLPGWDQPAKYPCRVRSRPMADDTRLASSRAVSPLPLVWLRGASSRGCRAGQGGDTRSGSVLGKGRRW